MVTSRKRRLELLVSHTTPVDRPERNSGNTFTCTGHSGHGVDRVCGRAVASPQSIRKDEDGEFGRGRIPTISIDHCFLGSDESDESAHRSPFLVVYHNETEAIFAIAVASNSTKPWIVELVKSILYDLGYGQLKISIKCDGARELQELRGAIGNSRESPTVPIDVPARESKA